MEKKTKMKKMLEETSVSAGSHITQMGDACHEAVLVSPIPMEIHSHTPYLYGDKTLHLRPTPAPPFAAPW